MRRRQDGWVNEMNEMESGQLEGDDLSNILIEIAAGTFPDSPNIPDRK
jgi:hypothetical protein